MGPSTGGFYFFRTGSDPGTTESPALYDMIINDAGRVGIGVGVGGGSPLTSTLQVNGGWDGEQGALQLTGHRPTLRFTGNADSGNESWLLHLGGNGPGNLGFFRRTGPNAWNPVMEFTTSGSQMQIYGQNALALIGFEPFLTLGDANSGLNVTMQGAHGDLVFRTASGHAYFDTTHDLWLGHPTRRGAPGRALVDGGNALILNYNSDWQNTIIGGNNVSVCSLTIRGGCDLAEPFPMKEEQIDKGSVVVIDKESPGRLRRSTHAYDKRVAGIVSGANGISPGIALTQEGVLDQGQNVALTGRVYVKADASFGEIEPGDLLTTSDTPGHAMKVNDHARSQGAILGKAMSALKDGQGMVLVLVTLQ
jgi:hypothetical protein